MLSGRSVTAGGAREVPVPVKKSDAFTVPRIFSVAASAPVVDGVKTMNAVHEVLAAMDAPLTQLPNPLFAKLEAFAPVIVKYGVASACAAVPVLLIVTTIGKLLLACC